MPPNQGDQCFISPYMVTPPVELCQHMIQDDLQSKIGQAFAQMHRKHGGLIEDTACPGRYLTGGCMLTRKRATGVLKWNGRKR